MLKKIILAVAVLGLGGLVMVAWEMIHLRSVNTPAPHATFADPTGKSAGPSVYTPDQSGYSASRTRIFRAWEAYWGGDLRASLELFTAEKENYPNSFYGLAYSSTVVAALPDYDRALKELQAQLVPELDQADRESVYLKIYKLSKAFYDAHGMETEASGPAYGPEFAEAEKNLTGYEEPSANKLIRDWQHYESCTDANTANRAVEELNAFMQKFTDSPHKKAIGHLLEYYNSGSAICGHKKTIQ